MKKIKNMSHLKAHKKKLLLRQKELEKAISYDWRDLKESFKPKNVAGQVILSALKADLNDHNPDILAETLSILAAKFTKTAVEQAEEWLKSKR
jgi:hypothetical protein